VYWESTWVDIYLEAKITQLPYRIQTIAIKWYNSLLVLCTIIVSVADTWSKWYTFLTNQFLKVQFYLFMFYHIVSLVRCWKCKLSLLSILYIYMLCHQMDTSSVDIKELQNLVLCTYLLCNWTNIAIVNLLIVGSNSFVTVVYFHYDNSNKWKSHLVTIANHFWMWI